MRYFNEANKLHVDFPNATRTWKFYDTAEKEMSVLAIHPMTLDGCECFAVALQSQSSPAEIRLLCASTSITNPAPLTLLIVTFDQQYPTSFASTDGALITPQMSSKTLLAIGLNNGDVYLINLSRAFRLDVCRENAQRTSSASSYTFDNFMVASGGIKVRLNSSTSTSPSPPRYGKVNAIAFIEQGGSFGEAALAVVRDTNDTTVELRVVYLDPQLDRTKAHCTSLERPDYATHQSAVGWSLKYIHNQRRTLLTVVCSDTATVYHTTEYSEDLWRSNSQHTLLSESNCRSVPETEVYVGLAMSTGKCALLVSASADSSRFDLAVQLIQLDTNEVLFREIMDGNGGGDEKMHMCVDAMKKGFSSLCISCKMSYSATQLVSGQVDQEQDHIVDVITMYVPCQPINSNSSSSSSSSSSSKRLSLEWRDIRSKSTRGRKIILLQEAGSTVLEDLTADDVRGLGLDVGMVALREVSTACS